VAIAEGDCCSSVLRLFPGPYCPINEPSSVNRPEIRSDTQHYAPKLLTANSKLYGRVVLAFTQYVKTACTHFMEAVYEV